RRRGAKTGGILLHVRESCPCTEVENDASLTDQGVGPGLGAGRVRRPLIGPGPGLDRLPALALHAAPGPRQRLRVQVAVRRVLPVPTRAADRAADPGPLLSQLLRREANPRHAAPAWPVSRLEQEEVLRGQSLHARRLLIGKGLLE